MRGSAQRGQTLPVWTVGTLTLLLLGFYVLNYADQLRWQIRAQNAADAAAQGVLSVQATQWNQMLMLLHASAVEEFRIQRTLDGMLLTLNGLGGCTTGNPASPTDCGNVYSNLYNNYTNEVARYTNDVALMQRVTALTQSDQFSDMRAMLTIGQQNCGTGPTSWSAKGLDCAFNYTLVNPRSRNDSFVEDVYADAVTLWSGGHSALPSGMKDDLTPSEVEVITCANVQPLIPSFMALKSSQYPIIGRAAATSMQVTQEWMAAGHFVNPFTGKPFQPTEYPEDSSDTELFGGNEYDWYSVEFGSNKAKAFPASEQYTYHLITDEFSEWTGWWSSIPIRPYSGLKQPGVDFTCK